MDGMDGSACFPFPWQRGLALGSQRAPGRSSSSRKSSLRAEDTLESIQELGSLELMGRDLGLAHYGPLRKSISADSLNSISSIGNNFGQDFTVGQVEVSMEYDGRAAALHVTLLQGKDLLEKEDARFESCFMRVSLLPAEQIVGISRVSPSFPPRTPLYPEGLGGSVPWPHSPRQWWGLGAGSSREARIGNGWHRIWGISAPPRQWWSLGAGSPRLDVIDMGFWSWSLLPHSSDGIWEQRTLH